MCCDIADDPQDRYRALEALSAEITTCRHCPRLVAWRERIAQEKRAAFAHQEYWGQPVPGFGDPKAWLLIVGLAPAAHGANRSGRMFTGDRSGDFLYGALWRAGFTNQPESHGPSDGLVLRGVFITAILRCPPPGNRPLPQEKRNCSAYLERELELLSGIRTVLVLGGYAYDHMLRVARTRGWPVPSPKPPFGHGQRLDLGEVRLLASYHPSQQNTFTGRLTPGMLDVVLRQTWD